MAFLDNIAETFGKMAFLNKMAITFGLVIAAMAVITAIKPLREPKIMPTNTKIDMKPAASIIWIGAAIIVATVALYVIFW